jgi:TPR repeat protein
MRLRVGIAGLGLALVMAAGSAVAGGRATFATPEAAYEQGIAAFRSGQFERAIPALEFAAARYNFLAQFYLARIYADSTTAYCDDAKAYMLYRRLGDEYADVDPDDDQRAPFVAKALTALAAYVKHGVREIGLDPDPERAAEYLRHAATFFNDEDAQFELAKLYLNGDGVEKDGRKALHYLSVLTTERRHAGAQALLADLYWRGGLVQRDPLKALALISVAVENAPASERVWIEDIYQNIFCGASEGVRHQAEGVVAEWRLRYRRRVDRADGSDLGAPQPRGARTCANDEPVTPVERSAKAPLLPERPAMPQGPVLGFTLKEAGVAATVPAR